MTTIQGRVVDYDSDEPISGVQVTGIAQNGGIFATATTKPDGTFTISNDGFDSLYSTIRFSRSGYASQEMQSRSANNVDIPLPKAGSMPAYALTLKQNKNTIFIVIAVIAVAFIGYMYFKNKK